MNRPVLFNVNHIRKYFEAVSKENLQPQKLMGLAPKQQVMRNGIEEELTLMKFKWEIPLLFVLRKLPVDGKLISGSTAIDESMLTGKFSRKKQGDEVIGASINKTGSFQYEATRLEKDTALSQIFTSRRSPRI